MVEPGMLVEATEGDLGEEDLSKPEVAEVVQDPAGNVEKIVVRKGVIFKKEIEVPAERIAAVEPAEDGSEPGRVLILATEEEAKVMFPAGTEVLSHEAP